MIVIPLVVASLMLGVASLGDIRKLGRIGGKTVGYYLLTTAVAITIGLALALIVQPGEPHQPGVARCARAGVHGRGARERIAAGGAEARPSGTCSST